jgi:hypothetical protein
MEPPQPTPSLPADYYRKHASRVRAPAAETTTPEIKEHFLEVARQYDNLAAIADEADRMRARSR